MNLKIADFGLCNVMKDSCMLTTACGSPDYAAPEIIQNIAYDGCQVDAWSCGVILYAMLVGRLPFDDPNQSKVFHNILHADYKIDHT